MLQDQVAIVTGAGRGIGRAIAIAFADEGARLWLAARSDAELAETATRCREAGATATAVPTDVADRLAVTRLVEQTLAAEGRIDALVNCAGMLGPIGPLAELDLQDFDEWERALRVNLFGPAYLCRAVLPSMLACSAGRIIVVAGGGAAQPMPNFSAYAASKAALVRLMDTLAAEVQEAGVCVNAIAPGLVDTALQDAVLAAGERAGSQLAKIQAARQSGVGAVLPSLAAELAVFLASNAAAGITGKLIAAPHDPWRQWTGAADALNASPLYTLRRLDSFTIRPLLQHPALALTDPTATLPVSDSAKPKGDPPTAEASNNPDLHRPLPSESLIQRSDREAATHRGSAAPRPPQHPADAGATAAAPPTAARPRDGSVHRTAEDAPSARPSGASQ